MPNFKASISGSEPENGALNHCPLKKPKTSDLVPDREGQFEEPIQSVRPDCVKAGATVVKTEKGPLHSRLRQTRPGVNGHRPPEHVGQELNGASAKATARSVRKAVAGDGGPALRRGSLAAGGWGTSSIAFIGPMCRPRASQKRRDFEDKLSEFYKELGQVEPDKGLEGGLNGSPYNKEETGATSQAIRNRTHRDEEQFEPNRGHRPYHQPRLYAGGHHDDHWQEARRPRQSFSYGPDGPGWDSPYYPDQGQHRPNYCPPYRGHQQPPLPTGPFYPPDFRPGMDPYCDYSEAVPDRSLYQWEPSGFPLGPGYPVYEGYGHGPQTPGYSEAAWFPPRGPGWSRRHNDDEEEQEHPPGPPGSPLLLILMRGLPGSGKSTLAKELLYSSPGGLVLSTDDYFSKETNYCYDVGLLGDAHDWNQNRAREAMDAGHSPVIIDNTNSQAWEMKPYVELALERGYQVEFLEPDTGWKDNPAELEMRNRHGVPRQKIAHMLERFQRPMSVGLVLNSQEPPHRREGPGSRGYEAEQQEIAHTL